MNAADIRKLVDDFDQYLTPDSVYTAVLRACAEMVEALHKVVTLIENSQPHSAKVWANEALAKLEAIAP